MIPLRALSVLVAVCPAVDPVAHPPPPDGQESRSVAEGRVADEEEPRLSIRFHGRLPGSVRTDLEGTFRVEFRIYRSPQGGAPVWREVRDVEVVGGAMRVELGEVDPIPFEIHTATFKWLGASVNGQPEVYPRFAIVNVVYVSPEEALLATATQDVARDDAAARARRLPDRAEPAATWADALQQARARGGELPSYAQWYADLARCSPVAVMERVGHYEWVLPWVYDTASHGEYNRYFRGRFQGCDYMDLSPQKEYVFRIAAAPVAAEGGSR